MSLEMAFQRSAVPRWMARILSSLYLVFFMFIIIANLKENLAQSSQLSPRDQVGILILFLIIVVYFVGCLLGWKRETLGGAVGLAAAVAFQVAMGVGTGAGFAPSIFIIMAAPGFFYLYSRDRPVRGGHTFAELLSKQRASWHKSDIATLAVVSGSGLLAWVGIALTSGVREAWDSPAFFVVGIPIMLLVTGIAGALRPGKFWLWGIAIVFPQPLAMMAMAPLSDAPLIVFGLFYFSGFVLICTISSFAGWILRKIYEALR